MLPPTWRVATLYGRVPEDAPRLVVIHSDGHELFQAVKAELPAMRLAALAPEMADAIEAVYEAANTQRLPGLILSCHQAAELRKLITPIWKLLCAVEATYKQAEPQSQADPEPVCVFRAAGVSVPPAHQPRKDKPDNGPSFQIPYQMEKDNDGR